MRIFSAENPEDRGTKRVWLNSKDISDQAWWRAKVPNRPGVTGIGWVDRYEVDAQGNIVFVKKIDGPRSYRSYGLVRWAERV